jgi:hypothetical protein
MLIFLILLMLGFFYEVVSGALNWYNTPSYYLMGRFISFNEFLVLVIFKVLAKVIV